MKSSDAIAASAALAWTTRLETRRLLVRHEPDGVPAGELARRLDGPSTTVSAPLATPSRAGLIKGTRHSRSIIHRAKLEQVQALTPFLLKDRCGGDAALRAPLIAALSTRCAPTEALQ